MNEGARERVSHPLVQLTLTRFREFLRTPEALFWVFVFPLLMAIGLGLAFRNRPPEVVRIAVQAGPGADDLAARVEAAGDGGIAVSVLDSAEAVVRLRRGGVTLVLLPGEPVVMRYDSTRADARAARLVTADAIQRSYGRIDVRVIREVRIAERGHRYIDFLMPGLLGLNLMGTSMWGVGFAVVQMRVRRLLKRLLASPMRRSHFLMSFGLSRLVSVTLEVVVLVGFGLLAFQVPFRGSVAALAVVALVGSYAFAGLGLMVASRAQTVEGVSGLMNAFMLPMWLLSGVFFSNAGFPEAMQSLIQALPLTALADALRAVMIDGASLASQWGELAIIGAWGVAAYAIALKVFRWL
jgi:ABC-type multidrug transport system permease subunit